MDMTLIKDGLILLVIGMGFVLIFLSILIAVMTVTSRVVLYLNKIFPEEVETVKKAVKKTVANVDDAIALAIAASRVRKE